MCVHVCVCVCVCVCLCVAHLEDQRLKHRRHVQGSQVGHNAFQFPLRYNVVRRVVHVGVIRQIEHLEVEWLSKK